METAALQALDIPTSPCFRLTQTLGRLMFKGVLRGWCGLSFDGQAHVAGLSQCVLAPTHASHLDFWAVLEGLSPALRRKTYVAAAEDFFYQRAWRRGLIRWFSYHNFPLNRRAVGLDQYKRLRRLLQAGYSLMVFAQGTRTRDGSLLPFRPMLAMLAADCGVPIVPVAVMGTFQALPAGRAWPRRHAIRVRFGAPLTAEVLENEPQPELLPKMAKRLNQELMRRVKTLYKAGAVDNHF